MSQQFWYVFLFWFPFLCVYYLCRICLYIYKRYKRNQYYNHCPNYPGYIIIDGDIEFDTFLKFRFQYHREVCGRTDQHQCDLFSHKKAFKMKDQLSIPLNIIIRSQGGSSGICKAITWILNNHIGEKFCYIHEYAFSSGTMIALSCNRIFMDKTSLLSPIDTQHPIFDDLSIPYLYLLENKKLCEQYKIKYKSVVKECTEDIKFAKHIFKFHNIKYPSMKYKFLKKFMHVKTDHSSTYDYSNIKNIGLNITYGDYPQQIQNVILNTFKMYFK